MGPLLWPLKSSKKHKKDILLNGPYLISLQWAENVTRSQFKVTVELYSGGDKTSVKTLKSYKAYISHNKAKNPINLGAK